MTINQNHRFGDTFDSFGLERTFMTRWFRRVVGFIAVTGCLIVILAGLRNTDTPGQIVACCIFAVLTFIAIFWAFTFRWCIRRRAITHFGLAPKDAALLQHPHTPRTRIDVICGLYAFSKRQRGFEWIGLFTGFRSLLVQIGSWSQSLHKLTGSRMSGRTESSATADFGCPLTLRILHQTTVLQLRLLLFSLSFSLRNEMRIHTEAIRATSNTLSSIGILC